MAEPPRQYVPATSASADGETQPLLQNASETQDQSQCAPASAKARSPHTRTAIRICIAIYIVVTLAVGIYFIIQKALDSIGPIGTRPTTTYFFVDPTPVASMPTWSVPLPDVTWRAQGYELRGEERLTFVRVLGGTATATR